MGSNRGIGGRGQACVKDKPVRERESRMWDFSVESGMLLLELDGRETKKRGIA